MGAGGYGAAGLSVRAGMGISELAGVCGKRAERSGVKAKAAAKGSMGRFPRKGQKSLKKKIKIKLRGRGRMLRQLRSTEW